MICVETAWLGTLTYLVIKVIAAVQYCCFVAPAGLTVQIFYSVAF